MSTHLGMQHSLKAIAAFLLVWASCLAAPGCGTGPSSSQQQGNIPGGYSFRAITTSLEIKKAVADLRGVLWLLDFSGRMHTLDPDLYLAPLPEAGEGVLDFYPYSPKESKERGMPAGLYLAYGDRGLWRLASDGSLEQMRDEFDALTLGEMRGGDLWVGTSDGFFEISPREKVGPFASGKGILVSLIAGPQGERLGVAWENRVLLLEGGDDQGRELEVPGELSVRVVALVGGAGGTPLLVTTQAVYRLVDGGLAEVDRYDDPVTSACAYGEGGVLLGRSSGRITLWREGGPEVELAHLEKAVDRLSRSGSGFIYAICGGEIYQGSLHSAQKDMVSRSFSFRLRPGGGGVGTVALALPESPSLQPLWYFFKVRTASREPSWELVDLPDGRRMLRLEDVGEELEVEALVVAESSVAWLYQPGDALTFPPSFTEEAENYRKRERGLPWDLEGLREAADQVPLELREDMLEVLIFLVKRSKLFYRTPATLTSSLPPEPGTEQAEEYARGSVLRALQGEGGDDYGRSLLLVMLCRELGIPAIQALCLDRYLAQVFLYGVGWVMVDVSFPIYDIESGSYPAIGSLPGRMESFVTATALDEEDLRFAQLTGGDGGERAVIARNGEGSVFASALVACRPVADPPPAEEQSLKLPEGGWYYFIQDAAGVRFIRQGPRRWDALVTGDERFFPLGPQTSADVFLVKDRIVLSGPPTL